MTYTVSVTRLQTQKSALGSTRIVTSSESLAVADGEVLLQLYKFALTTNNITYAAFGDAELKYWQFFPTGEDDWGHMPVWGFASVIASAAPGVEVGERFYGYFPINTHIRMQAHRITERGFYDASAHRQTLTSAYNQYTRCSTDTAYRAELESYQALLRPLFITSFMLADFLTDNDFFGAKQIVVSSASSKTAFGTAFCLRERAGIELTGLTSARHVSYVQSLACYDRVVAYPDVRTLDANAPTLYVDFSGDDTLRATIHYHFGESLTYDCYAGSAQNTQFLSQTGLPGPEPKLYFAPVQIRKRNADWGPAEVNRKFNVAQSAFIDEVSNPAKPWMTLVTHAGFEQTQRLIAKLAAGTVDPHEAHVVTLR